MHISQQPRGSSGSKQARADVTRRPCVRACMQGDQAYTRASGVLLVCLSPPPPNTPIKFFVSLYTTAAPHSTSCSVGRAYTPRVC
jgi:hypothetical protein